MKRKILSGRIKYCHGPGNIFHIRSILFLLFLCLLTSNQGKPQSSNLITIKVNEIKGTIQPTMWGVFFEDINMGADGGIYAELIKNRSFEFNKPMMGWKVLGKPATEGDFLVMNRQHENTANPRFLRITLHNNAKGSIGLSNEGFRKMGIKNNQGYDFSLMYRTQSENIKMHVELKDEKGNAIGGA